jgi:hypothetical protein
LLASRCLAKRTANQQSRRPVRPSVGWPLRRPALPCGARGPRLACNVGAGVLQGPPGMRRPELVKGQSPQEVGQAVCRAADKVRIMLSHVRELRSRQTLVRRAEHARPRMYAQGSSGGGNSGVIGGCPLCCGASACVRAAPGVLGECPLRAGRAGHPIGYVALAPACVEAQRAGRWEFYAGGADGGHWESGAWPRGARGC